MQPNLLHRNYQNVPTAIRQGIATIKWHSSLTNEVQHSNYSQVTNISRPERIFRMSIQSLLWNYTFLYHNKQEHKFRIVQSMNLFIQTPPFPHPKDFPKPRKNKSTQQPSSHFPPSNPLPDPSPSSEPTPHSLHPPQSSYPRPIPPPQQEQG